MSSAFGQVAAVGEFAELFTVPSIYIRLEHVSEWPNQSPEPTAVLSAVALAEGDGAVSSVPRCGTVHVASRRWLSFFG